MIIKKDLGNRSFFIGETFQAGENFSIGNNCIIRARHFTCGHDVSIGSNNNFLVGNKISIGSCSNISNNNDITGINIMLGDYLFLDSNVVIGHGGKMNYDSEFIIGNRCMICSFVKLNINYKIEIGDDVGIGEYVDVWTHGSYPPVLQGFPSQFGRVKIGSKVWLPAKSTVLPGVEIGDNVTIGVNSVINKSLPSGSLCAGIPVKILKEDMYPKKLSKEQLLVLIDDALIEYKKLIAFKGFKLVFELNKNNLTLETDNCVFDFNSMKIIGDLNDKNEDLRDFLRRRGIKFFTGKPFKSILPTIYSDLLSYKL